MVSITGGSVVQALDTKVVVTAAADTKGRYRVSAYLLTLDVLHKSGCRQERYHLLFFFASGVTTVIILIILLL